MLYPRSVVWVLIILVTRFALDVTAARAASNDTTGLQYQIVKFEKLSGAPGTKFSGASLQAEYPEFVGGASPDALEAINAFVRYFLPVSSGRQPGYTLDNIADRMLSFWRRMIASPEGHPPGMGEIYTVSVVHNRGGLLCVQFYWWGSGGAHPNYLTYFHSFEVVSGRRLTLSDFITQGKRASLDSIAEAVFRADRRIAPDSSLESAGYRFKDGRFSVTENFAVDSSGLLFFFNDYEIAAHVYGPQEVRLPFDLLAELVPGNSWLTMLSRQKK